MRTVDEMRTGWNASRIPRRPHADRPEQIVEGGKEFVDYVDTREWALI
jgi:hypothetical protein